jgi:hypothetical protein
MDMDSDRGRHEADYLLVGGRDGDFAMGLMDDLRSRVANRIQLTSDGHRAYLDAVEGAFGMEIDYAMLVKLYGQLRTLPRAATAPQSARAFARRASKVAPIPSTSVPEPLSSTSNASKGGFVSWETPRNLSRFIPIKFRVDACPGRLVCAQDRSTRPPILLGHWRPEGEET